MEIRDELIHKLCNLSRLKLEGEELEAMRQDLHRMLAFVESVLEVDTTGVEPLIHPTAEANRWREDVPDLSLPHDEALRNAPKKDSDYFRVPKFVEK